MKKSMTSLFIVLALSSTTMAQQSTKPTTMTPAQKVEAYYKIAEKAFQDGDKETTTKALRNALKINPKHGPSYALAIKLKKSGPAFKIKARQNQLASIVLPQIELNEAPLSEALKTLSTLVEEKSGQKVFPNFVISDRSGQLRNTPVTLNMKNVPASVILEYLMKLSNATAKYGEHATTIRPLGGSSSRTKTIKQENDF